MNFANVVSDIKKLIGMELNSIRPGSNITILEVDDEKGSLLLKTAQGVKRSRPLSELQIIWEELIHSSAVHVDEVLHGSGTSRNQPETILANLPYIEWLKINNKKHIAFIGKASHAYGVLKQMNAVDSAELISSLNLKKENKRLTAVVVCEDVAHGIRIMSEACPGIIKAKNQGIYTYQVGTDCILFHPVRGGLEEGTYVVIENGKYIDNGTRQVEILNEYYKAINLGAAKALIKQEGKDNQSNHMKTN